jgi:inhibitor of KinA sporulation pathway (predicted exonuclease)
MLVYDKCCGIVTSIFEDFAVKLANFIPKKQHLGISENICWINYAKYSMDNYTLCSLKASG